MSSRALKDFGNAGLCAADDPECSLKRRVHGDPKGEGGELEPPRVWLRFGNEPLRPIMPEKAIGDVFRDRVMGVLAGYPDVFATLMETGRLPRIFLFGTPPDSLDARDSLVESQRPARRALLHSLMAVLGSNHFSSFKDAGCRQFVVFGHGLDSPSPTKMVFEALAHDQPHGFDVHFVDGSMPLMERALSQYAGSPSCDRLTGHVLPFIQLSSGLPRPRPGVSRLVQFLTVTTSNPDELPSFGRLLRPRDRVLLSFNVIPDDSGFPSLDPFTSEHFIRFLVGRLRDLLSMHGIGINPEDLLKGVQPRFDGNDNTGQCVFFIEILLPGSVRDAVSSLHGISQVPESCRLFELPLFRHSAVDSWLSGRGLRSCVSTPDSAPVSDQIQYRVILAAKS